MESEVKAVVFGPSWSIHTQRWVKLLESSGVTVQLVSWPRHQGWRAFGRLPGLIRRARAGAATSQLGVVHTVGTHGLLSLLVPKLPRQVLVPWGSELVAAEKSRRKRLVARRIITRSDLALTTSRSFSEAIRRVAPQFESIETFSWGVHSSFLEPESLPSRAQLRKKWGVPTDATVVFSPRGDSATYRFSLIIASFHEAVQQRPDLFLLAVGDTSVEAEHDDRVRMLGHVGTESMRELFSIADGVVSVPASDQRSTAVLEGIASGAHVILSDVPAYRELVADGAEVLILDEATMECLGAALGDLRTRDPEVAASNLDWARRHESPANCEVHVVRAVLRGLVE